MIMGGGLSWIARLTSFPWKHFLLSLLGNSASRNCPIAPLAQELAMQPFNRAFCQKILCVHKSWHSVSCLIIVGSMSSMARLTWVPWKHFLPLSLETQLRGHVQLPFWSRNWQCNRLSVHSVRKLSSKSGIHIYKPLIDVGFLETFSSLSGRTLWIQSKKLPYLLSKQI